MSVIPLVMLALYCEEDDNFVPAITSTKGNSSSCKLDAFRDLGLPQLLKHFKAKHAAIMADDEVKDEVPEITSFDPTKKKKKKKVVIQDPADESVDKLAEKTEALSVSEGLDFSNLKKKKKKPVEANTFTDESGDAGDDFDGHIDGDEEGEGIVLQQRYPWDGTDRDYIYDELLGRVFNILRENNPELAGDRRRTVMRPPQVLREGTKKTVFVNFMDLCKTYVTVLFPLLCTLIHLYTRTMLLPDVVITTVFHLGVNQIWGF
ncbi:eukaryotic translation initiation factor 2 subunit beta-like isoform X1 [Gossypium australe]|uniref:Eukaryotic translation initiation factor 2 subunit beta-like isoform X1 n=1 Tax=Gossypium australe TaxID=47621 RepID=A0A5B6VT51_9ROSI|nr:eukaryotic translation initiation factor 2 subunit beta-like isoform X1 [Gossypium australe]